MKRKIFINFIAAAVLFFIFGGAVSAQTTSFVFQGKLNDNGLAANGTYQFQFKMFDAGAGGNQVGQTLTDVTATVTNGIFAVNLDFGANSFDGAARFIEVGVRLSGIGQNYTILNPRQAVASTPYAVKSLKSDEATTAENSLNLGGIAANQYVQTTDERMSDDRNPLAGSSNYIQNTTNQQTSSNFNISGEGKANVFSANSQFNISGTRVFHLTGSSNTFVGFETGNSLTNGTFNAVFGTSAGRAITSGINNSFFGSLAGRDSVTGSDNSFFGQAAGLQTNGSGNSFFGYGSGVNVTSGGKNTFVGYLTGQGSTNETENTFIGYKANGAAGITNATAIGANAFATQSNTMVLGTNLVTVQVPGNLTVANTFSANALDSATIYKIAGTRVFHVTGTDNVFVGVDAGNAATGSFNSFIGKEAGKNTTTGFNNTFTGAYAGRGNITGTNNSFFGANAGLGSRGSSNSFFGSAAGFSNFNGTGNSFFGTQSGQNNESGQNNSFFGLKAGEFVVGGSNNTFVGAMSGAADTNAAGSNNTSLGYNNKFSANVNNSIAIGTDITVSSSNYVRIGKGNDTVEMGKVHATAVYAPVTANYSNINVLNAQQIVIDEDSFAGTSKFKDISAKDLEVETVSVNTKLSAKEINFRTFATPTPGNLVLPLCYVTDTIYNNKLGKCPDDFNLNFTANTEKVNGFENALKQQQTQIETAKLENQKLQEQLKQQQAQIDALKSLVCSQNPTAAVCAAPKEK